MTTTSQIVGVISFVRQKFVQNMVRVVEYVRKEVVAGADPRGEGVVAPSHRRLLAKNSRRQVDQK